MKSCARFIKSTYIDTSTLTANTIYRLGRSDEGGERASARRG